MRNITAIIETG